MCPDWGLNLQTFGVWDNTPNKLVSDQHYLLNLLGWHWLIRLYRFQVYISMIYEKRLNTAICDNADGPWEHHAKWNKLERKRTICFHSYVGYKMEILALACVAHFVGTLSHKPKGCGFNSQSGHIPKLQIRSWSSAYVRQSIDVSLTSIFLSFPLDLKNF